MAGSGIAAPDPAHPAAEPGESSGAEPAGGGFRVSLDNFDGPFDLLLSLITQHELDITEVSLSLVTDEFLSYLRDLDGETSMDRASEFLVVAATLLDLKIASLLPQGEAVDQEDIAVLEARDLLFARLLQYRAFKQASAWIRDRYLSESTRHARSVPIDPKYRGRGVELQWTLSLEDFAALAALTLAPRALPTIGLDHLHAPLVSIREQAHLVVHLLRGHPERNFRELIAGETETGVIVARFLAVLELYRRHAVTFTQDAPLGDLFVSWCAEEWSPDDLATLGADYDA